MKENKTTLSDLNLIAGNLTIMKQEFAQEIIDYYQKDRTLFYYFKDRYALMLLSSFINEPKPISKIKNDRFGRLLQKPIMKDILKRAGNGILTNNQIESAWPEQYECYLLTLDKWGGSWTGARFYNQTSRPGVNLVLQLNFSGKHNTSYNKLISSGQNHPFEYSGHPISRTKARTLAWARIDIDFDTDEALIEEIQNDWIRIAIKKRFLAQQIEDGRFRSEKDLQYYMKRLGCDPKALIKYIDHALAPHMPIWAEAMLSAAIWFLKEEIGINTIFYHTFKTGCHLKRIEDRKPPKSLYSDLPAKFCFEKTAKIPRLLSIGGGQRLKKIVRNERLYFYSIKF